MSTRTDDGHGAADNAELAALREALTLATRAREAAERDERAAKAAIRALIHQARRMG